MSSEATLLSCPFCGGEAKLFSSTSSTVQCQNDQCIIGDPAPFNDFSHRADAIAAWNTRQQAEARATSVAGDREAIARIISPTAMKSRETIREEWSAWMAGTDFGNGPNQPDKPKLLEQMVEQEWDELAPRRYRALAKADLILALPAPRLASQEQSA